MKNTTYETVEPGISKMWELQAQRTYHLKNLSTIYKQKEALQQKSEKQLINREKAILLHQKNKQSATIRKNRSFQDKVDYENCLLKNKLIMVMGKRKSSNSFYSVDRSSFKNKKNYELNRENEKLKERLENIKKDKKEQQKLHDHKKKADQYLQMIQKKSQKKKAYYQSLLKKKNYEVLPEIQ